MPICPKCSASYDGSEEHQCSYVEATVPSQNLNPIPSDTDLLPGDTVGEYVIENRLGQGAFGTVYGAVHPVIGKQAAVKVLARRYSVDAQVVSRFIAEARAVNQIRHENIIDIFSFGQLPDERQYYIMELLEGLPLDVYLSNQGRLELQDALAILVPLARALDAAHKKGIAHRDLKPANVFLTKRADGSWYPKLLDFGIAKLMDDAMPRQHQTATGAAVGTPHYMCPEQCQGSDVDHRTDIYAFGVMTYRMITGKLPFDGTSTVEILAQQLTKDPPPPDAVLPTVPPHVNETILWMMQKDRDQRPNDLPTAVTALGGDLSISIPPYISSSEIRTFNTLPEGNVTNFGKGKKTTTIAVLLALGILVGGAGLFFAQQKKVAPPPPMKAKAHKMVAEPKTPSPEITLTVTGAPAGTEVRHGDKLLGTIPGPIRLPRGEQQVALQLSAEGFVEKTVSVLPNDDTPLTVVLEKKKTKKKKKKKRKKKKPDEDDLDDW